MNVLWHVMCSNLEGLPSTSINPSYYPWDPLEKPFYISVKKNMVLFCKNDKTQQREREYNDIE